MSVEQLRALHHPMSRPVSLAATLKYFSTNRSLKGNNAVFAERLVFVASEHKRGQGSIATLVTNALARWPVAGI